MALTLYEQETIINYNREEKTASIFTHDPALIRKCDSLCEKSEAITVLREGEGWKEYTCPKSWIKVKMPRELTEEQRAELAERMKSLRKEQLDNGMD